MKHRFMIAAAVVLLAAGVLAQEQASKPAGQPSASPAGSVRAHADIKGEGISGRAEFVEHPQGTGRIVDVSLTVTGLKPGMHGVHLHAVGKCEPDFAAAGGHFDPGPAGNPDPDANHPFHMGDLPNIEANASGRGTMRVVTTRVTLSDGPVSLLDSDGSAIIIHGNEDQMKTGEPKSGVSGGPRVACGVIQK
jgi:Cu-Zn family superoxide dismutase